MRWRRFLLAASVAPVALIGVLWGPNVLFADSAAPASVRPYVEAARADLASNLNDHQLLPFHLRFLRAECRAEGGAVFIFEQRVFPYTEVKYAYAMSGFWPPSAWSGGAQLDVPWDTEMARLLGGHSVPCP